MGDRRGRGGDAGSGDGDVGEAETSTGRGGVIPDKEEVGGFVGVYRPAEVGVIPHRAGEDGDGVGGEGVGGADDDHLIVYEG